MSLPARVSSRKGAARAVATAADNAPDTLADETALPPKKRTKKAAPSSDELAKAVASTPPLVLCLSTLDAACATLGAACPRMALLVAKHGPATTLLAKSVSNLGVAIDAPAPDGALASVGATAPGADPAFTLLAHAIAGQQLSTKAAATIWRRLEEALGGAALFTPSAVLAAPVEKLRSAGLSGRKAEYLVTLASAFSTGMLSSSKLSGMSDDQVVTALTSLRGLGVWSAHMFLIFGLARADVFPTGDGAIVKAYQKVYGRTKTAPAELAAAAAAWAPYRSLAAWYLWRSLE